MTERRTGYDHHDDEAAEYGIRFKSLTRQTQSSGKKRQPKKSLHRHAHLTHQSSIDPITPSRQFQIVSALAAIEAGNLAAGPEAVFADSDRILFGGFWKGKTLADVTEEF